MCQMAEGHGRHRRVQALGRLERRHQCRTLRVHPELVVDALHQLHARGEPPRELRENLVLLVGPRERRVRAGLTVIVAQVLIPSEKPEPVANHGTAEIRREVTVTGALVPARRLATRDREPDGLAGQAGRLPEVRRVVLKAIAPLFRQHVENGALDVAELGGHSHGLDLDFLNDVNARLGARNAGARAGEVGAVDEKQVLVAAGAERGHGVHRAA